MVSLHSIKSFYRQVYWSQILSSLSYPFLVRHYYILSWEALCAGISLSFHNNNHFNDRNTKYSTIMALWPKCSHTLLPQYMYLACMHNKGKSDIDHLTASCRCWHEICYFNLGHARSTCTLYIHCKNYHIAPHPNYQIWQFILKA